MTHTETALTKNKFAVILEWLFLFVTGIYLVCQCIYQSTYVLPTYTFPDRPVFLLILCTAAALGMGQTTLKGMWNVRTALLALTAVVFFLAYRTGRELFLLMIPVLMAGTAGMDYRRALKVYVVAVGSFLAITILCSFTGVIPNIIFAGSGHFRSSWGIAYPTDFASLVLFFVMMLWLAWEEMPAGMAVLSAVLSLWVALVIAESRTSALCGLLFLAFILYHLLLSHLHPGNSFRIKLGKGVQLVMAFSFVVFAVVYFIAVLLYARGTEIGAAVDRLFSYRLYLTLKILREQGILAFGNNYPQVGLGGITIESEAYYFLDSSYAMLLIRYGWVLFLATAVFWTVMGLRAYRAGDRKLLFVMTVIAFHAMSEHHFPDVQYNMLVALPFATIPLQKEPVAQEKKTSERIRENWAAICCGAALLLTAVLAAPLGLSRLRTVFDIWGTDSSRCELRAVLWCAILLLAAGTAAGTLCRLVSRIQKRHILSGKTPAVLALSLTVLIGMILTDSHVIRLADESGQIMLEKVEVLERLLNSASGKVVANEEPELLRRRYPGISRSVWYGQDLARQKNLSVIVSLEKDGIVFSRRGFLFTQISPDNAVYSDDPSVIKALAEAGHEWTAYDSAVREVDLKAFAEFNELEPTEQGSLVLENGERLNHGPYLDFYSGTYRVTFDLKSDTGAEPGEPLCSVYVVTLEGKSLAEKTIGAEELNHDGTCSAELIFDTSNIRYLQFPVFPVSGQSIEVTAIHYQRIG